MENLIIEIMNGYGYLGTFLLIMLENLFPPIPSEIILTFGGFMTKTSEMTILGVIITSTLGSVLGGIILYYLGKLLNKDRLIKIVSSKYGKLLQVKPKDIENADKWFDEKGNKTVFFCRFIPIIRSLISIPAGMSEMPMIKFLIYTFVGSGLWNTALVLIGAFAYEKKAIIFSILEKFEIVVILIVFLGVIYFGYKFYKTRIKKGRNKNE